MEEMIAVKPYINAIKETVLGFPSYNEKPKINGRQISNGRNLKEIS